MLVEEGSLYPALYRLERRGWLEAELGVSDLGRRAKLYRLTDAGRVQLADELATWKRFSAPAAVTSPVTPASNMTSMVTAYIGKSGRSLRTA